MDCTAQTSIIPILPDRSTHCLNIDSVIRRWNLAFRVAQRIRGLILFDTGVLGFIEFTRSEIKAVEMLGEILEESQFNTRGACILKRREKMFQFLHISHFYFH